MKRSVLFLALVLLSFGCNRLEERYSETIKKSKIYEKFVEYGF